MKTSLLRRFAFAGAVLVLAIGPSLRGANPLRFAITEGNIENQFYREGPVAAHLLATSGTAPRLIVAFPAGNTGVALWFEPLAAPAHFGLEPNTCIEGVERADGMRGITARLHSDASTLVLKNPLLANIRVIRDAIADGTNRPSEEFMSHIEMGSTLVFHRTTADGGHHIELRIKPAAGTIFEHDGDRFQLTASVGGHVEFSVSALADDPPLTPFGPNRLLNASAADLPREREALTFLASEEKFTAGSWRFLTYFGRDTLLSVQMLMPVLQPEAIEAALGSVLVRLGPDGEVAHEEAIGEFAAIENRKHHPPPRDLLRPVLDYKMIDSDFLLAPAIAAYLLDTPGGRARASGFLARKAATGETYGELLRRNLALVLRHTAQFAGKPRFENLVALKPGVPVGDWRDSEKGLGGGRYPFDVNVALAPAALRAAMRLYQSGLFGTADDAPRIAQAARAVEIWSRAAEPLFRLTMSTAAAKEQVAAYAQTLQLDAKDAVASIDGPVIYHALALDVEGRPIPVMHSDASFVLFFTEPTPDYLESAAREILRPFPAGLRTAVGIVVANPVFGGPAVWREFTGADYHGTVAWSWQQALLAAGLERQLARRNLPASTRELLTQAQHALWQVITAHASQSTDELWSWEPRHGHEALVPYGQAAGHADESNAAQLWSTVYLAIRPPRSGY